MKKNTKNEMLVKTFKFKLPKATFEKLTKKVKKTGLVEGEYISNLIVKDVF